MTLFLSAIGGYLLGSIPFGLVLTKLAGLGDVRAIGSGNIGATNVLRTGRKDLALATLLLDAGKGAIAVLIVASLTDGAAAQMSVAGAAAFLGHCYPAWLSFKGGKGVATFLGTLLALYWPAGLAACAIWLVTAFATRISSLSALVAAVLAPIVMMTMGRPIMAAATLFMTALILVRHRANIQRIIAGTEPKIGNKDKS
ncbi:MAG: glycerol-3-phosphate 1-O-acyltransferase PlsY [Parvularculaceae bacterium]